MSRRYPGQNGEANTRANRERQRYSHTSDFHTKHLIREMREQSEAKLAAYKEANPEAYAEKLAARAAREAEESAQQAEHSGPTTSSTKGTTTAGAGSGAAAVSGAGMGALGTGVALAAVGVGTALLMNRTILKDDPSLDTSERRSRSAGRVGSYAGAALGTAGTMTAIGASGSVAGLSGAGIVSGVGAIGGILGGGVAVGTVLVVAAPAIAAAGIGYLAYKTFREVLS